MTSTNRRNPPARWVLPTTVNPTDTVCFQIPVPNDPAYIAAFRGALLNLCSARQWQNDPAHTAVPVANVWKGVYDAVVSESCVASYPTPVEEMEIDMSVCEQIRFNPATGLFEGLCCGSWSAISGQPAGGFVGAQSGNGTLQPSPGGGCQIYHMTLNGREQAVLPTPVNTGDTVIISNLRGVWYDGTGLWYCGNGGLFFAGVCGPTGNNGADPLPGSSHMALLTKVGGVFHNISDGAIYTIPAAVSNLLLIFQANDSTLTDDGGDISFDVTVCNNQAANFSHTFDFTVSAGGWTVANTNVINTWVAGVGWKFFTGGVDTHDAAVQLHHTLASRTISTMTVYYTVSGVTGTAFWALDVMLPAPVTYASGVPVNGSAVKAGSGATAATKLQVFVGTDTAAAAGQITITKVVITGIGTDPF